jgi:hypothetical protein
VERPANNGFSHCPDEKGIAIEKKKAPAQTGALASSASGVYTSVIKKPSLTSGLGFFISTENNDFRPFARKRDFGRK